MQALPPPPDNLTLFSDIEDRLEYFIDSLAESERLAKEGRFSRHLQRERNLKLLLQNLDRSLEMLIQTLGTVTKTDPNGQVRIKPRSDSTEFEWMHISSLMSELYEGMDSLNVTLRKFLVASIRSTDSLETPQSNVLQLADNADDPGNTGDMGSAEDPEDLEDVEVFGDFEDSDDSDDSDDLEDPKDHGDHGDPENLEKLEAEAHNGRVLVDHINFVIDKAIIIDSRVQMVHCSEASTSSDAITSIQQNLPRIINILLKTQEHAEFGTYTIVVKAQTANLLGKLPSILGNVERFFGSDEQRQARQSPNDPQAEEVQRVSEMIETILVGLRKHENEISVVSGLRYSPPSSLQPEANPDRGSSEMKDKKKHTRKWLYLDFENRVKGPWSDTQMYSWYEAGYLPRGLYVREVNDTDFQPLSLVIEQIEKTQSVDSAPLLQTPPGLITIKNRQFHRRDDILPDITRFMKASNLFFNPYPIIEGNHIDVADLFIMVVTNGGSKRITVERGWVTVAISVGLPTEECPNAPQELESYWNQNLLEYEESLVAQPQEQGQALSQTTGNVTKDFTAHVIPGITVSAGDDGDAYDPGLKVEVNQSNNDQSARLNIEKGQDEEISAPNPSFDLQSFGHGAPEGYQYQYSDCTRERKALLISINSDRYMNTLAQIKDHYGFKSDNIISLNDIADNDTLSLKDIAGRGKLGLETHLATKKNILKGMTWLVRGARTNDCLLFYYTGKVLF